MFDKKFFDKNIEPRCEYCSEGFVSADGKSVLCRKKGVVDKGFHCRKFSYDPLKRVPEAPRALVKKEHDPGEFEL